MSRRRRTRGLTAAVGVVALVVPVLLVSGPGQAVPPDRRTSGGTFSLPPGPVVPDTMVAARGSVPPRHARPVRLQVRRQGSWVVLLRDRSDRRGKFLFGIVAPARSGDHRYRVVAPRTRISGRTYRTVTTPVATMSVLRMTSADVGWLHACSVADTARAWCWGDNTYGELGDGSTPTFTEPTIAPRPRKVVGKDWDVVTTAGASTCGVKDDATGWCWGDLATYQFDDPYRAGTPQQLAGTWKQLAPGAAFYWCGVDTAGVGWCQGKNDDGQLGHPDGGQSAPTQLSGSWRQVVPGAGWEGSATTCGIRTDRSAWCWGEGGQGQLGDGGSTSSSEPVEVAGGHAWESLSVGGAHVCGVDLDGAGWCWGLNTDGRLGDGTFVSRSQPTQVGVAATWLSLDAGFQHTCGVTTTGQGWCWGNNDEGQLGDGTSETVYWPAPSPSRLEGRWTSVAAGQASSAGTMEDGTVHAWGRGAEGQLGSGEDEESTVPRYVFP